MQKLKRHCEDSAAFKKQEEHASLDKVIKANAANPVVEGISGAVDSPIDLSGIKASMQNPGYSRRYS